MPPIRGSYRPIHALPYLNEPYSVHGTESAPEEDFDFPLPTNRGGASTMTNLGYATSPSGDIGGRDIARSSTSLFPSSASSLDVPPSFDP